MNSVPIGTIISFMGITAPDEYLICDGTVYNIDEYKELADFFKEEFGSYNNFGGNGTTTFAVPDLQGEFLRGAGTNSHANQGSGANVGEHQDGTEHWNFVGDGQSGPNTSIYSYVDPELGIGTQTAKNKDSIKGISNYSQMYAGNRSSDRNYIYYTSRPTNTSVLYCIKYKS